MGLLISYLRENVTFQEVSQLPLVEYYHCHMLLPAPRKASESKCHCLGWQPEDQHLPCEPRLEDSLSWGMSSLLTHLAPSILAPWHTKTSLQHSAPFPAHKQVTKASGPCTPLSISLPT